MIAALDRTLSTQVVSLDRQVMAQLDEIRTAAAKALTELNARLEIMNAFRGALTDQASRFATKDSVDQHTRIFEGRLQAIEIAMAENRGRTMQTSALISIVISLVVGAAGLAAEWLRR